MVGQTGLADRKQSEPRLRRRNRWFLYHLESGCVAGAVAQEDFDEQHGLHRACDLDDGPRLVEKLSAH